MMTVVLRREKFTNTGFQTRLIKANRTVTETYDHCNVASNLNRRVDRLHNPHHWIAILGHTGQMYKYGTELSVC